MTGEEIRDGPPEYLAFSFRCPWCRIAAQQFWNTLYIERESAHRPYIASDASLCTCHVCDKVSLWYEENMVIPSGATAPLPHPDLPAALQVDYLEARDIVDRSPRGAAALLRLVIEQLCPLVGGTGADLNACIKSLVRNGLDVRIQQMLDIVRVIGGQAVHPLQMDLRDDMETAMRLFALVNMITDDMITKKNWVAAEYAKIPQEKRDAIEKRDNQS